MLFKFRFEGVSAFRQVMPTEEFIQCVTGFMDIQLLGIKVDDSLLHTHKTLHSLKAELCNVSKVKWKC